MIHLKSMAGLGNQLFQYACGRALAARLGTELGIWRPDATEPPPSDQPPRPLQLQEFAIQCRWIDAATYAQASPTVFENPFTFHPSVLTAPDGVALDGFWQSERYFADATALIRQELEFANPQRMERPRAIIAKMREELHGPIVAVHVRRGDYVLPRNQGIFHNLSLQWFRAAMARLPESTYFLVFSDDLQWCKTHLQDVRFRYAPGLSELDDLALMRACDGYILSNSSYSWWGAWLSDNPNAPVIAPSPDSWFGPRLVQQGLHDASHIIPGRWIQQSDIHSL
jgi:hypothetical protein